jgi:drug/metabolite transporter (DMT)-like permease
MAETADYMSETGQSAVTVHRYLDSVTQTPDAAQRKMFEQSSAANSGSFTAQDWGLFVSIAAIWGSSFLLIDIALEALPPGVITLIRVGSGALALSVLPKPSVQIAHDDRGRLVLLSMIWVAIPFTLFPIAEQYINSSVTGLLNGATPIFAASVAAVLLRQRARGALLAGIVVGFVGIVLISAPSLNDGASEARGVFLVLAATLCYGFAVNLAAPLQQRYGTLPLMARMLALATLWTTPYGLWQVRDAEWRLGPLVAVLVLGVVGTGLAFAIMGTLVGRVGSTRASFITYLIPVVSLALGIAFRDDTVAPLAVGGIALVIVGAILASRARTA